MPGQSALQKTTAAKPLLTSYRPIETTALRSWYAYLGQRETTPASVVVIGDSITEGSGSSNIAHRWISVMQRILRSRYGLAAGADFPFIPAWPLTTSPGMPVVRAGTVVNAQVFGLGLRAASMADATGSLTFTFTGTSAKIMFAAGTSTAVANIVVDGGAATTFDTVNGSVIGGKVYSIGALTAGTHTVRVARDATSQAGRLLYVEGLVTYNGDETSGLRIYDAGHHGIGSTQFTQNTSPTYLAQSVAAIGNVGLVIFELGANDAGFLGIPAATTQANLQTIATALRSKGFNGPALYLALHKEGQLAQSAWDPYVAAIKAAAGADTNGVFLDMATRIPNPTATSTDAANLGLYQSDVVHPTDAGHGWYADVIAQAIGH